MEAHQEMKAVIMAGGKGTRLLPLTHRTPKPMLPLLDRPTLEYVIELLVTHGIRDIMITVCYKADAIKQYFGDGSKFGARIKYSEEFHPLGTAGGVRRIMEWLDDTFIVMSGDGLTDFDLGHAIAFHHSKRSIATLLLKRVTCPEGFGVVLTNDGREVQQFIEKPKSWSKDHTYQINTGIYIFEPDILQYIPCDIPYDFGRQVFPALIESGVKVYGYEAEGYWSDIGTLHQYYLTQLDMIYGKVKVRLPGEISIPDVLFVSPTGQPV